MVSLISMKIMNISIRKLYLLCIIVPTLSIAQPSNDDCSKAIKIVDVGKYCSKIGEFTNVGATPSLFGAPTCWQNVGNDVWFSFRAIASDVTITIRGINAQNGNQNQGGTLRTIAGALYSGNCGGSISQLSCFRDVNSNGVISFSRAGLTIGESYLIRVDGTNGNTGTFQLCINNYFPPSKLEQDCRTATVLCINNPFVNKAFTGAGVFRDEANGSCLGEGGGIGSSELASTWYTWISKTDCDLTFTITPLNQGDDIDFALYELPSGIHQCSDKVLVRCNASAPPCTHTTGLSLTERDTSENFNCDPGENGFSKSYPMKAGTAYTLIINNFTPSGIGFNIEWGSCEFVGPVAIFVTRPDSGLRCETLFELEDFSNFPAGQIDSFIWNFGVGARPQGATTKGPHNVFYESIGEKFITLTLVTNLGCRITTVKRIFAEPCCEDLPTIGIKIDSIFDVICNGESNGRIVFKGIQGYPYTENSTGRTYYTFSLNGIDYYDQTEFRGLSAGTYTLYIQDRKGCTTSIPFTIKEPEKIIVDAGSNQEILLGDFVDLNGIASPSDFYHYDWIFEDSVLCTNCQTLRYQPSKEGFYKVIATNSAGCQEADSIFIRVKREYKVFAPNVMSPNGDGVNDFFNIEGNPALESVDKVEIFDRWGGRVFSKEKIQRDQFKLLWDGRVNGEPVNPGVFVYRISARFIDGTIEDIGGDITIMR